MASHPGDFSLTASPGRPLPLAVRAEGCRIVARDGREYIDACGGAMVTTLGHRHPRLVAAAKRQLDQLTFTYRFSFSNEPMVELARLLRDIAPMDAAWSFFNSSGSESVESAIHLAVLYWQLVGRPDKVELISRYPSFHGSTLGALGLSGSRWRRSMEAVLDKNAVAEAPNADIRSGRSPAEELQFGLAQVEQAIVERGSDRVAAVFLEPITGASGAAVTPPDDYLEGVREICTRNEVLMICDETISGFGRTGTWWAGDHWGVSPDVLTFGKGVTSGIVPFSGMLVAGDIAEVFESSEHGFPYGHTFSGNPLGCAVAAEAIKVIVDDDLLARSTIMGERLRAGLESIAGACPYVGQVRGRGLLQGMEIVADKTTLAPLPGAATALTAAAKERGLMIYACPTPLGDHVIEAVLLAPPLTVTEADVDEIITRLGDSVSLLTPAGR